MIFPTDLMWENPSKKLHLSYLMVLHDAMSCYDCTGRRSDIQSNDTEPNDTKPNDTEHNDTKPNDTKPNDTMHENT